MAFAPGDAVQTRFGKGVVREVRNHGQVVVDVRGRAMVMRDVDLSPVAPAGRRSRPATTAPVAADDTAREGGSAELDLHGLTVADALARAELALNDALLADAAELRLIHGRSGGRIRAALHRRLAEIPAVRSYRLDPLNPGVTIVHL